MFKWVLLILCILQVQAIKAQEKGQVTVHADPRLSVLLNKTKITTQEESTPPVQTKTKIVPNQKSKKGVTENTPTTSVVEEKEREIKREISKVKTGQVDADYIRERELEKSKTSTGSNRINKDDVSFIKEREKEREREKDKHKKTEIAATNNKEKKNIPPSFAESKGGRYAGQGFRIQIYYGTDRNKALQAKASFMRTYPGIATYLTYSAPSYRVRVGNYKNREDAHGMFKEASSTYSPCMIVPDDINIR